MAYENTSNSIGSKIGRGIRRTWDALITMIVLTVVAVVLFGIGSCFGLPSLVHQPTAHQIYDSEFTIVSRHAVHPLDRLIHAGASCPVLFSEFMTPEGRNIAAGVLNEKGSRIGGPATRRVEGTRMIFESAGLAMPRDAMHKAAAIRAAYRADQVDLVILRHLVDTRCPG